MVKTVLMMATITLIACAAVIAIHEFLVRARHRRPVPRRDAGRFKKRAAVAAGDDINRSHNEN